MPPHDEDGSVAPGSAERKAAELRAVLDALPLATAIRDRDGRFLYANAAAAPGYGVTVDGLIGKLEHQVLPAGNDVEDVIAKDRDVIDSGRSLTVPGQRFRTSEGRLLVLHVTRDPVRFDGVPAVLVTAMDVTGVSVAADERRRVDRRLAEAQRLEGLGLLAGGIAHDFNNLLVGVLANAELALREAGADSRIGTHIDRVKTAANRLAGLSRQMLAYSGHGHVDIEPVGVSALAAEMLQLLKAHIPGQVRVVTELAPDLPTVHGDRAQLSQVIMNLVTNASEAIGTAAGTIRVSTREEFLDSARTASLTVRALGGATEYLCLEVRDDGPGMDEATRNRIFEPFFSTTARHGRGLGLASVIGIVRAHQGALQVDSAAGAGTRIRVWLLLSATRARASRSRPVSVRPDAVERRVLIVDDEPVVREATSAVLEARGFVVHAAADGDEAVAVVERIGAVDVVVLDMTMPGRSVSDTHRALRALIARVPILLTSGFSELDVLGQLLDEPATHFLPKPYGADELYARLQTILQ